MALTDSPAAFPMTFAVSGGDPRVDLALRAEDDGTFVVDVLTERSLAQSPPLRLGAFRGRLPAATLDTLAGVVAASVEGGAPSAPGTLPPGSVVRLVATGGEAAVPAVGEEARLAELDRAIAEAAAAALRSPVAAIVPEARAGADGPVLALTAIGDEPFRLLVFASDTPGYWARTWIDTATGQDHLAHEAVAALVAAGSLPDGPVDLAPGASLSIPLPPAATAGSAGGFIAWRAGRGFERRIVTGSWSLPAVGPEHQRPVSQASTPA